MSFLRHLSLLSPLRLATLQPPTRALKPRKPRKCECIIHFSPILQKGVGTPPSVSPFQSFSLPSSPLFFFIYRDIERRLYRGTLEKTYILIHRSQRTLYIGRNTRQKFEYGWWKKQSEKGTAGKMHESEILERKCCFQLYAAKKQTFSFHFFFSSFSQKT